MQEILYEETAQCANAKKESIKYKTIKILGIISFFLAFIWFLYIYNFMNIEGNWLLNLAIHLIPLTFFIVIGIVLFKLKNHFCVDYDYILVSGSIRVSKVVNNSIRQTLYRFNCSEIDKIGPFNSSCFNDYINTPCSKIIFLTSNKTPQDNKSFYYIKVNIKGVNTLLIFECSKMFIFNLLKFSKISVRDVELK